MERRDFLRSISIDIPIIISYQLIAGSDKPKWLPISLVLIGMILAIWTGKDKQFSFKDIFAPVIVFLTFGISNSMLKIIQDRVSVARADWPDYMVDKELALVSACIFLAAMLFCSVSFFRKDRAPFRWRNLLGGMGLGAANYGCTYILMLAMKTIDSSILFPFHNLGIVAIGAIVGWICFHEKMRPHQVIGIVMAAAAIFWLCICSAQQGLSPLCSLPGKFHTQRQRAWSAPVAAECVKVMSGSVPAALNIV